MRELFILPIGLTTLSLYNRSPEVGYAQSLEVIVVFDGGCAIRQGTMKVISPVSWQQIFERIRFTATDIHKTSQYFRTKGSYRVYDGYLEYLEYLGYSGNPRHF